MTGVTWEEMTVREEGEKTFQHLKGLQGTWRETGQGHGETGQEGMALNW